MSIVTAKQALIDRVFNINVRRTAESAVDETAEAPLWLRILAGGNINHPDKVIDLAQDVKNWEEETDHGSNLQ